MDEYYSGLVLYDTHWCSFQTLLTMPIWTYSAYSWGGLFSRSHVIFDSLLCRIFCGLPTRFLSVSLTVKANIFYSPPPHSGFTCGLKGGQCEYRRALPPSFLFKFFIEVSLRLEALSLESDGQLPPPPVIGDADRLELQLYWLRLLEGW